MEKILFICCYFDYHPKTRLIDVKIGFGPSGKIEKVECTTCKKVFIHTQNNFNRNIILIIILLLLIVVLFF